MSCSIGTPQVHEPSPDMEDSPADLQDKESTPVDQPSQDTTVAVTNEPGEEVHENGEKKAEETNTIESTEENIEVV